MLTSICSRVPGAVLRKAATSRCTYMINKIDVLRWPESSKCRTYCLGADTTSPPGKEQRKRDAIFQSDERVASNVEEHEDNAKDSVVIFDKDGTLICFHAMWTPWALNTAEKISVATGLDNISRHVYDLLGFCPDTLKCKPGLLAEGTMVEVKLKLVELLVIHGMELNHAQKVIDNCWENRDASEDDTIKMLHNLKSLFTTLKEHGVKIAVCTADSRLGTERALTKLGITDLVDIVVCGDDVGMHPKPNPHNAYHICETLGVDPTQAFMVGDTLTDMKMGNSAALGATIGVLSGVASEDELKEHADHLVPHVGHLLPIVLRGRKLNRASSDGNVERRVGDYLHDKFGRDGGDVTQSELVQQLVTEPQAHWGKTKDRITSKGSPLKKDKSPQNFGRAFSTYVQKRQLTGLPPSDFRATHVIVGAGSAGCVLANRLTEDDTNKVVLIESGPKDDWWKWKIHMPAALMYNLMNDKYNWYYHTEPQKYMNNRVCYWPRGRVWGGSSSLNAMCYVRGHAYDYDRWEREGAKGWDYSSCLPYFKKAQSHELGGDDYRGDSGPLGVTQGKCDNPLFNAFIEAGKQAGFGYTEDMNGYKQEGVAPMDMTIKNGKRCSASQAYLWPIINRPNLYVMSEQTVSRVLIEGNRAIGVQCSMPWVGDPYGESANNIYADSDVILCGGAINSPQILMLSGIGPADHLFAMTVPLLHDLPGVGQNLQDHLEVYVQQACTKPISLYNRSSWKFPHKMIATGLQWFLFQTGDGASSHLEAGGFLKSNPAVPHPDIQLHFLPATVNDHGRKTGDQHAYQLHVCPARPTSKGYLKLQSRDPKHPILMQPNYLETEQDRKEMRDCVRLSRQAFAQSAFDPYRGKEIQPGQDVQSDEDIDAFVRAQADSAYHPSCTCKMGAASDKMSVVDPETMKVHGMEGLRVVDASVMPSIVSGNLNAPTIMVAEKAADIIRGKTPLPKSNVPVWNG